MTRLLKPLFHNPSTLLIPSTVTPPPSVSSHSCSPAPTLFTQHAPADCSDDQKPTSVLIPEPSSPPLGITKLRQGASDLRSPLGTVMPHMPPVFHCSAPPSLNSSPHEHTVTPPPYSSSSIPSLSSASHPSSITPLLIDLSEPDHDPQTHPPSHLLSHSESKYKCKSQSYPHSLHRSHFQPQPLLPTSNMATQPRDPHVNLQKADRGMHTAELRFIDEGRPSV